jgi:hypothetical protein
MTETLFNLEVDLIYDLWQVICHIVTTGKTIHKDGENLKLYDHRQLFRAYSLSLTIRTHHPLALNMIFKKWELITLDIYEIIFILIMQWGLEMYLKQIWYIWHVHEKYLFFEILTKIQASHSSSKTPRIQMHPQNLPSSPKFSGLPNIYLGDSTQVFKPVKVETINLTRHIE